MATPLRQSRRASRDPTPGSGKRHTPQTGLPRPRSGSQSGIPMATSRAAVNRQTNVQPSYDFLKDPGNDAEHPLKASTNRMSMRQSTLARPDLGNEDLRAQLKTLQYELDSYKQERELTKVRHEKELRDAQKKADADAQKAHTSVSSSYAATSKYETLVKEMNELKDASANRQHELEKNLRAMQEEARTAQEDLDEAKSTLSTLRREHQHKLQHLDNESQTLRRTVSDLELDSNRKAAEVQSLQERLADKEKVFGDLESEVLQLRTQSGNATELTTIKEQLSEQVNYVRKLEKNIQDQNYELRKLRETHRAVAIVEEEKRSLERKIQHREELERELGEAKFQWQVLLEERKSWTAHLQGDSNDDLAPEFDSPEAMGRALTEERTQRLVLSEQLGAVQPLLAEKEELLNGLEEDNKRLKAEIAQSKKQEAAFSTSTSDNRFKARLHRQQNLLTKEVEYLRAQLRTFDLEDTTQEIEVNASATDQTNKRLIELEDLVANYQQEVSSLHKQFSAEENKITSEPSAQSAKRPLPDDIEESEQLGTLSRKNRKLQDALAAIEQRSLMLERELEASKAQIASLNELARIRVLSMRDNPTEVFERVKLSQIRTLRIENEGLHALLERKKIAETVPRASLDAKDQELEEWKAKVAEREKRMLRLKQSWAAKALELRQAIASILGWKVEFAPNGKFKLSSIFYPQGNDDEDENDLAGDLGDNYLIFDGERGTVQVSGGPDSEFAQDIKGLVKFWVDGRKEIPGLMAACTLEFYERTTRAMRV